MGIYMSDSSVKIKKKKAVTEVAIIGTMTIDRVGELRLGLQKAFSHGKPVELSLAGVTDVDLTGLQLLCSSHRTSIAREVAFSVIGADADTFAAVADLAGMARHAGCAAGCVWVKEQ
jgi:anti-anti-sigma regulatory factor